MKIEKRRPAGGNPGLDMFDNQYFLDENLAKSTSLILASFIERDLTMPCQSYCLASRKTNMQPEAHIPGPSRRPRNIVDDTLLVP